MSGYDFDTIYRTYQKQMLFVAERILHNRSDAEDAVQNALLRISRQVKYLPQNETALRAYVLTAAKHAALDLLPKQSRDADIEQLVVSGSEDLFEKLAASQDYDRLLASMRCLPLKYREVLMLRYVQELEVKQIAKLLGRSRSTVHKQLTRAKQMLTKIYQKEDFYHG